MGSYFRSMEIINSKEIILNHINNIFNEYNIIREQNNEETKKLTLRTQELNEINKKLMWEITEKDKLLVVNDKKMIDYEIMINKIQDDANKELSDKERFDMIKKQDQGIHERDIEIQRLQSKLDILEKKSQSLHINNNDHKNLLHTDYNDPKNSFHNDSEKVNIAIQALKKHKGVEVTIDDVARSSLGINGWYNEGLPDNIEDNDIITEKNSEIKVEIIDPQQKEIRTEVIDNPDHQEEGETTEDLSDDDD